MSGSDNYTTSIGIQNLSQPFENPIPASLLILLIVLGILGIIFLFCLVFKFLEKMFYHHSTTSIEPIFNIGTYHRRISNLSNVIHISPAHSNRTPCMSVWTGQDRKSKFEDGHVQPDQIKSKNPTNASEEKEKTPLEVPSFGKLDVMELSELVDHKEKIM